MPRIINPSDIHKSQESQISDELILKVIRAEVVLVLGHEHMLDTQYAGGDIIRQLTEDYFAFKRERDPNFNASYPSFNDYYYSGGAIDVMKSEIVEMLNTGYNFAREDFSPAILSLLDKKCFRVVLTTTFDYYVETFMRQIWGDELRVLNIFDQDHNDISDEDSWRKDIPPTLYYVFGRAERGKDYTVIDKDAMNTIQRWLGTAAPKNFCKYLSDKCILSIGTKFDDWLFRFFWFALHRDLKQLGNGQVAISLCEDNDGDKQLSKFLQHEKIPNTSVEELTQQILTSFETREAELRKQEGRADVFLSYFSESYDTVKFLFYALKAEGLNVWFDNHKIGAGDAYDQKITRAISECKVFVPIITQAVQRCLQEDITLSDAHKHYFRDVEWQMASSRYILERNNGDSTKSLAIMPFCMEGVDMKNVMVHDSQKDLVQCVFSASAGNDRTQANFQKFISDLKNRLK